MKLILTNFEGDVLELTQNDKYILVGWNGFASTAHSLVTDKAPDQIGTTVINKIFESRNLNINFIIKRGNKQSLFYERRNIIEFFNSDDIFLDWEQEDGTAYRIKSKLDNLQMPGGDGRGQLFQLVQIDLLCEDPCWFDVSKAMVNLDVDGNENNVNNQGDIKTSCQITINGPIINPVVKNMTVNKDIFINGSLENGEKFIINTEFGNKELEFVNSEGQTGRCLNLLDLSTEMFYLAKGINNIIIEGTGLSGETFAQIEFYNRYLGV